MNINHGRIRIHLKELLQKSGMSKNKLAHRAEMQWRQIAKYYNNDITRLDTDVLARLCYALDCTLDQLTPMRLRKDRGSQKRVDKDVERAA